MYCVLDQVLSFCAYNIRGSDNMKNEQDVDVVIAAVQ